MSDLDILRAWVKDPDGFYCGFCGQENDNVDDIGFFYHTDPEDGKYKPYCLQCQEILKILHNGDR